ncbi:MAG TPA: hypothetical protein VGO78_18690, partial [Acidimicrobiales bacterium]|nr:hypothetical protein [Acidimicrobiales bacterium]
MITIVVAAAVGAALVGSAVAYANAGDDDPPAPAGEAATEHTGHTGHGAGGGGKHGDHPALAPYDERYA